MKRLLAIIFLIQAVLVLGGCETKEEFKVYIYDGEDLVDTITSKEIINITDYKTPEKEGYHFTLWGTDSSCETVTNQVEFETNTDLYACYESDYSVVTFKYNEEEVVVSQLQGTDFEFPTIEVEGYHITGWYIDDVEITDLTEVYGNMILEAQLEPNEYTLTIVVGEDTITETVPYGSDYHLSTPTVEEGYRFVEWTLDGEVVESFEMPCEDIVIFAVLEQNDAPEVGILFYGSQMHHDDVTSQIVSFLLNMNAYEESDIETYGISELDIVQNKSVIDQAASDGVKTIVAPGWMYENLVYYGQTEYPDINFILLEGTPNNSLNFNYETTYDGEDLEFFVAENTISIYYKDTDLGFVAGYLAVMEGYRNLGFMGGVPIPIVVQHASGFVQGANQAAQELGVDINVNLHYGLFTADVSEENVATSWYTSGTEYIYCFNGGAIASVIYSAEQNNGIVSGSVYEMTEMSTQVSFNPIKNYDITVLSILGTPDLDSLLSSSEMLSVGFENNHMAVMVGAAVTGEVEVSDIVTLLNKLIDGTYVSGTANETDLSDLVLENVTIIVRD